MMNLKKVMAKSRPLSKNTSYEWCNWLISHCPKSVKKSASGVKEKITSLFQRLQTKRFQAPSAKEQLSMNNKGHEQLSLKE